MRGTKLKSGREHRSIGQRRLVFEGHLLSQRGDRAAERGRLRTLQVHDLGELFSSLYGCELLGLARFRILTGAVDCLKSGEPIQRLSRLLIGYGECLG